MLPDRLAGNRQYCLDKAAECDRKAAHARDPNAAKEFHRSPHDGAWQQQPVISITKSKTFCGRFGRPLHHDADFIALLGGAAMAWPAPAADSLNTQRTEAAQANLSYSGGAFGTSLAVGLT
jgi:hypothetical protein